MTEQNRETEKILSEAHALSRLAESDGWIEAKKLLFRKMSMIDSISTIEGIATMSDQELAADTKLRFCVKDIIQKWIQEIEGSKDVAKQYSGFVEQESAEFMATFE